MAQRLGQRQVSEMVARARLVPGLPAHIRATQCGTILSVQFARPRVLSPKRLPDGYLRVEVRRDGQKFCYSVAHLVLAAWDSPRPSQAHQVQHLDGDRGHCALHNLRWSAERRPSARKVSPEIVAEVRRRLDAGESQRVVARAVGLAQSHVGRIARGEVRSHAACATPAPARGPRDPNRPYARYTDETPAESAAISRSASLAIEGVQGLIVQIVRRVVDRRRWVDLDEAIQRVQVQVWQKSLPRFDRSKGAKLSTFLHTCAIRAAISEVKHQEYLRRQARAISALVDIVPAPDRNHDRDVERLAAWIVADPDRCLLPGQAEVMKFLSRHHGTVTEAAIALGYTTASGLAAMVARIRERVREIAASN
ncbi:MAG: sigma factor [Tepidisphaeraceae bacterium]